MKFLSFFRRKKSLPTKTIAESLPVFWPDDYCAFEIMPAENRQSITDEFRFYGQGNGEGRTITEPIPVWHNRVPLSAKEIRVDYLEQLFIGCGLIKAEQIKYQRNEIWDGKAGSTRAFGFSSKALFFDLEGELVKNIWPVFLSQDITAEESAAFARALYALGEECELILVAWDYNKIVDLADKGQVKKYLDKYTIN